MYVCVYVCTYVYIYVLLYVCLCMYVCMYIYVCMYVCVVCVYICMNICTYVLYVYMYVCMHVCMYVCVVCIYVCVVCIYVCVVCTYVYISQNFSKFMLVPYILNIITMQYHYNDFLCQTLSMYATDVAKSFVRSVYPACLAIRSDVNRSICWSLKVQYSAARVYKPVSVCLAFNCSWSDVIALNILTRCPL